MTYLVLFLCLFLLLLNLSCIVDSTSNFRGSNYDIPSSSGDEKQIVDLYEDKNLSDLKFDNAAGSRRRLSDGVKGMRAAIINVQLEGNLAGELDTTPLLQTLDHWGVKIDLFSLTTQNKTVRLEDRLSRPLSYVDNFYRNTPVEVIVKNTSYDIVIVPPQVVGDELDHCIGSAKMVWFGVTAGLGYQDAFKKLSQCLVLVTLREEVSFTEVL